MTQQKIVTEECLEIMKWGHQWPIYTIMLSNEQPQNPSDMQQEKVHLAPESVGFNWSNLLIGLWFVLAYASLACCASARESCYLAGLVHKSAGCWLNYEGFTWENWNVLYLSSCRLTWACSHNTNKGQEGAEMHGNFFQTWAWVTSVNIPLAGKHHHMSQNSRSGEIDSCFI